MQYFPNQYDDNINDTMTLEIALDAIENTPVQSGVDYDADRPFEIAALESVIEDWEYAYYIDQDQPEDNHLWGLINAGY